MALVKSSFLNFEGIKNKEYDKKLIVISPNPDFKVDPTLNTQGLGVVVGFIDALPRISGTANWKSYSELLGDAIGDISTLKDTIAATTGNTSFMYGDITGKFFTGGGEFSFDVTFRCVSYTPWQSRYSAYVNPTIIKGNNYLIGDCRNEFNRVFALCFPSTKSAWDTFIDTGEAALVSPTATLAKKISENGVGGIVDLSKASADSLVSGFNKLQPTVGVTIGSGNVSYFASDKMIVKSVNCQYSEEWVKLDNETEPVPMFVDVSVTLELAQLAGLSDISTKGGAIKINFK